MGRIEEGGTRYITGGVTWALNAHFVCQHYISRACVESRGAAPCTAELAQLQQLDQYDKFDIPAAGSLTALRANADALRRPPPSKPSSSANSSTATIPSSATSPEVDSRQGQATADSNNESSSSKVLGIALGVGIGGQFTTDTNFRQCDCKP